MFDLVFLAVREINNSISHSEKSLAKNMICLSYTKFLEVDW